MLFMEQFLILVIDKKFKESETFSWIKKNVSLLGAGNLWQPSKNDQILKQCSLFSSELLGPKTNKTISFLARQIRVYVTFHSSSKLWFLQNVNMYCSYIHSFIGDIDVPSQSLPSPRFFHSFYWWNQEPGKCFSRHAKRPTPQNATVFNSGDR